MKKTYIFFICTLISLSVSSQKLKQEKYPKKAAIYSAVIPGSGQIYTKKYWKVPIIYGGLITSGYFIKENQDNYNMYKEAALTSIENNYENQLDFTYSELITLKDVFKSLLLLPGVIVGIIIGRTDTVKNYVNVKFKKLILLICLICSLLVLGQAFISYQN